MLIGYGPDRLRFKRQTPGQHLIQRDPQRINIAAGIRFASVEQLGAHVGRTARDQGILFPIRCIYGHSEIRDFDHPFLGHHDIVRLDVTVHKPAFRPDIVQRFRRLLDDMQGFIHRKLFFPLDPVHYTAAGDIRHRHIADFIFFSDRHGLDQIDMTQGCCCPGFPQKIADPFAGRIFRQQNFQRHLPFQRKLRCQIYRSYCSGPYFRTDQKIPDHTAVLKTGRRHCQFAGTARTIDRISAQ